MLSAQKRLRDDNDDEADYAFFCDHKKEFTYFCKHKEEICRIIAEKYEKLKRHEELKLEKEDFEASRKRKRERDARKEAERKEVIVHLEKILWNEEEFPRFFKDSKISFLRDFMDACYQLWKYLPEYLGQVVHIKLMMGGGKYESFLVCLTDTLFESDTTLPLCAKLVTEPGSTSIKQWKNLPQTEFKVLETNEVSIKSAGKNMDTMPVTISGKSYKLKQLPLFFYDVNEPNTSIIQAHENEDGSKVKIVLKKEGRKPVWSPEYSEEEEDDLDGDYSPRSPQYSPPEDDDSK